MNMVGIDRTELAQLIRVEGLVQGVGFRPTVWHLAQRLGLRGTVCNDGSGVLLHVCGPSDAVEQFVCALRDEAPPLARIERIRRAHAQTLPADAGFVIQPSRPGAVRTAIAPDAASCPACVAEVFDPAARRYRHPFANCAHCGPRLSIVRGIPYDRSSTSMRAFVMCPSCRSEYEDPADRRFHAQPIACPQCGPQAQLALADGAIIAPSRLGALDAPDAVRMLLLRGDIVAIKGLGGFQLACDAVNAETVARLRRNKHRDHKPFALMARDLDQMRRYCIVTDEEEKLLCSPAAPIVVLARRSDAPTNTVPLAQGVAPGLRTLGFMLPNTALHHLILQAMTHPIVLTSGNRCGEPQQIDNQQALQQLGAIADVFLLHDRDITRRVDDSVLRMVAGHSRVLRRARGMAPLALQMPPGFGGEPPVLALGGELKNSFCLLQGGRAVVSHHIGDLQDAPTFADFQQSVRDYLQLFEHKPAILAVDRHPNYLSGTFGRAWHENPGDNDGLDLIEIGHHHAHIAACLAENGMPLDTPAVIGVALDGLGYGANGELWGGEFLHAGYDQCRRLATFKPVALIGGAQAMREPWRNTYAHLVAAIGWERLAQEHGALHLVRRLAVKPRALLDGMLRGGVNSPLASSCGRLFDAVAAACGICFDRAAYEGQAAMEFEALADEQALAREHDSNAYRFAISHLPDTDLPFLDPLPMWRALLDALAHDTPTPLIAARFHKGLAIAISAMVHKLSADAGPAYALRTVALSGGVFQNRILLEQVTQRLQAGGFDVLSHRQVPANDGGLSLGQAAIAAARALARSGTMDDGAARSATGSAACV